MEVDHEVLAFWLLDVLVYDNIPLDKSDSLEWYKANNIHAFPPEFAKDQLTRAINSILENEFASSGYVMSTGNQTQFLKLTGRGFEEWVRLAKPEWQRFVSVDPTDSHSVRAVSPSFVQVVMEAKFQCWFRGNVEISEALSIKHSVLCDWKPFSWITMDAHELVISLPNGWTMERVLARKKELSRIKEHAFQAQWRLFGFGSDSIFMLTQPNSTLNEQGVLSWSQFTGKSKGTGVGSRNSAADD